MNHTTTQAPANTLARTDGLGGHELAMVADMQSIALAEAARAQVETRYKLALARPRDFDDFRLKLLRACERKAFAALAEYSIPRGGKKIEGASIRLVEEALRHFKNVLVEQNVISDDDTKRTIRVTVTDLEANITYPGDVVVTKTLERKNPDSFEVLGQRKNSYGEVVFIVKANDDDLLMKQGALVSKKLRELALRILPSEVIDEAKMVARATRAQGQKAVDPDEDRKNIADSFNELNIMPSQLKAFLGCELGQTTPAQRQELRMIYVALRDGVATWASIMADREVSKEAEASSQAERLAKKMPPTASAAASPQTKPANDTPPSAPSADTSTASAADKSSEKKASKPRKTPEETRGDEAKAEGAYKERIAKVMNLDDLGSLGIELNDFWKKASPGCKQRLQDAYKAREAEIVANAGEPPSSHREIAESDGEPPEADS